MAPDHEGFDREEFSAPMAEINVTPMVDVMLVLLVVFLVTAPMLTQAVKLELPDEIAENVADENPLVLSLDADGDFFIERQEYGAEALEKRLKAIAAADASRPVHLRIDRAANYGSVNTLLAMLQRAGLKNVGFITDPNA